MREDDRNEVIIHRAVDIKAGKAGLKLCKLDGTSIQIFSSPYGKMSGDRRTRCTGTVGVTGGGPDFP